MIAGHDQNSELGVLEVSAPLTDLPAGEFLNHTALVVSTSETEPDADAAGARREVTAEFASETSDQLTALVAELNPDLTLMLQGAREALSSRRADFVRHFVTSYRELFTHVLHLLSPDEEVCKWTKDPAHYHNKRPTRRARLLFITRELGNAFGGFASADVAAVTGFVDAFNKGTHDINPSYTDEQLLDLKNRTEGLIRFLLVIYRVTVLGKQ